VENPTPKDDVARTPGPPSAADDVSSDTDGTPSAPKSTDTHDVTTQKRSNEFVIAVLGVIATMVVGIAGGVSTYFTGLEHDKQENIRARDSATRESISAQSSFTRSQQVAAYTAFTNACGDLAQALDYQRITIVTRYAYAVQIAPIPPSKQDPETLYAVFVNAVNAVSFSGSQPVQDAAKKVLRKANEIKALHADWEINHSPHPNRGGPPANPSSAAVPSIAEVSDFDNKSQALISQLYDADKDFSCKARNDLGLTSC
jgi:hypothetical protein